MFIVLKGDSHDVRLTRVSAADSYVAVEIGNFLFFSHCDLLPSPSNARVNEP